MARAAAGPASGIRALLASGLLLRHQSAAHGAMGNPIVRWLVRRRLRTLSRPANAPGTHLPATTGAAFPGGPRAAIGAVPAATLVAGASRLPRAATGIGYFTRLRARHPIPPTGAWTASGRHAEEPSGQADARLADALGQSLAAVAVDAADLAGVPTARGGPVRIGLIDQLRRARIDRDGALAQGERTDKDARIRALAARIRASGAQSAIRAESIRRLVEADYGARSPAREPVADRAIPGTAHIVDGREPYLPHLMPEDVKAAVRSLVASDFGGDVLDAHWAGDVLVVATRSRGAQHFRIGIDSLPRDRLGQTEVHRGTSTDPHRTTIGPRVADDQVARTVLHEVTHTFNDLDSARRRSGQRLLRRALFAVDPLARAAAHRDDCVAARFNDHRFLSRLWTAEYQGRADSDELAKLAHEIAGVVRVIEEHGRTAPPAPWEGGVRLHVPRSVAVAALSDRAEQLAIDMQNAATGLQAAADSHVGIASKADAAAGESDEKADKAKEEKDRSHAQRERKARANADLERAGSTRHNRIAESYRTAQARAKEAQQAFLDTAPVIAEYVAASRAAARPDGGVLASGRPARPVAEIAAEIAGLTVTAQQALAAYHSAMADALPPTDVLPSGMPTGRLPHLAELTRVVNQELESQGVDHRYTAEDLQSELRSDFRRVASKDGAVLRLGVGTPAELRIALRTSDLVEVLDPEVKAAELMLGSLPQGGMTTSAAANRTFGGTGTWTPTRLVRGIPHGLHPTVDAIKAASSFVSFGFSGGPSRGEATTGGASGFALGGAVQDNRGESSLYDCAATWQVQVRTRADPTAERSGWSRVQEVSTGTEDDASRLRFWLSHAYTAGTPEETAQLPPGERQKTPLPHHAVVSETGHEELAEELFAKLGHDQAPIGSVTRDQIKAVLTDELPGLLGRAVDTGILRVITDDFGNPAHYLQVDSEIVLEPTTEHPDAPAARMVGAPSTKELLEELRVGFSGTSGSASASRTSNRGGNVGLGFRVDQLGALPGVDDISGSGDVFDDDVQAVGLRATVSAGRSRSRSAGAAVSSMSIHPSVQRYSGHTQGYRARMVHRVRLTPFDRSRPPATATGKADVFVRMAESEAYRYGLPVDRAAIELDENGVPARNRDGSVRLRGDLDPDPPPGRKAEPPEWWSKVKGVGHGLVREFEGVHDARIEVLDKLAARGLVPSLDGAGDPIRATDDDREWESQLTNLREVFDQLSVTRLETGYDQAAQTGLVVDLVRDRSGHPSEHVTMRMQLVQGPATYEGHTPAYTTVGLDIGSNTSTRSGGRARGRTVAGMAGAGLNPGTDQDPARGGAQTANALSGSRTRTTGTGRGSEWSAGDTVNQVTLVEGSSTAAQFRIDHSLIVELVEEDGRVQSLSRKPGSARVLVPSDLLPETGTPHVAEASDTPEEVLQRLTVLQADMGDPLAEIEKALKYAVDPSSPAYHHLVEHLSVDGIRSHLVELLHHGYRTELAVSPQGASPTTATVAVTTTIGQSRFITASDLVVADINFTMGSHGTAFSESTTGTRERSLGGGVQQQGDDPTGAGVNWSRSQTTSTSRRRSKIWGRERLTVEVGKHYVYEMSVDLQVAAKERGATLEPVTLPDRTVVYSIPERNALELYTQGKLDVPLTQVADAVQRYVQGDLLLDRAIAPRLVRHYLRDLHAAGPDFLANNEVAREHTIENLVGRISELYPLTDTPQANESAQRQLARHLIDARTPPRVDMPEHLRDNLGQSAFERIDLSTADGKSVQLFDQVLAAVQDAVPGVDNDPVLWQQVFNDLAGKRWWGKVDNMLDPNGFTATYPVRDGMGLGASSTSDVTVRIRAEFADDAVRLDSTDKLVQIGQDYNYLEHETTRSSGRTAGAGVTSNTGAGLVGDGTLGTDRSRNRSGGAKQQETVLQRVANFDGADLIRQGMRLVIEVERGPTFTGPVPTVAGAVAGAVTPNHPKPQPVVLTGQAVRLIPDGLSRTVDDPPDPQAPNGQAPAELRDPRAVLLPERFNVESTTAGTLLERVSAELGRDDLLGADGLAARQAQVEHQLSAIARSVFLQRMTGSDGFNLIRLTDPNDATKVIQVRVRARPSELGVIVGRRENTELGVVNRMQRTGTIASAVGRLWPFNRGAGAGDGETGAGLHVSSGEQASQTRSGPFGLRRESSLFERGNAVTVRMRMDYDLTFERRTVAGGGDETVDTQRTLPSAATGTAYVTMFERDLDEIRAQQERGGPVGQPVRSGGAARRGVMDRVLRRGVVTPTVSASLVDVEAEARNREGYAEQPHLAVAAVLRERGAGRTSALVRLTTPADPNQPSRPITLARLVARDLGVQVALDVAEADGVRQYVAAPTGALGSPVRDRGFAAAYGTLPPELLTLSDLHRLPMREVFDDRSAPGSLADRVRARLHAIGVTDVSPAEPLWPGPLWGPGSTASVSSGSYVGGVTSRHIPGTAFVPDRRAPHLANLGGPEIGTAFLDIRPNDFAVNAFGPATGGWDIRGTQRIDGWTDPDGDRLGMVAVDTDGKGVRHFSFRVAEPGELAADVLARTDVEHEGSEKDPYVVSFAPRLATDQVSRVWVHEITDTFHRMARQEAAAPRRGVVRDALARLSPFAARAETRDECLPARRNEHRLLVRQWLAAPPDSKDRARLRHEIEGVTQELIAHGDRGSGLVRQAPTATRRGRYDARDVASGSGRVTPWRISRQPNADGMARRGMAVDMSSGFWGAAARPAPGGGVPNSPHATTRLSDRASAYQELREQEPSALLATAEADLARLAQAVSTSPEEIRDDLDRAYAVLRDDVRQLEALQRLAFALRVMAESSSGAERARAVERLFAALDRTEPLARKIAIAARAAEELVARAHGQVLGTQWRVIPSGRDRATDPAPGAVPPVAGTGSTPQQGAGARQVFSRLLPSARTRADLRAGQPGSRRSTARRLPPTGGRPQRS